MRGRIGLLVILAAAAVVPCVGEPMTGAKQPRPGNCQVVNGENLPTASGGSRAICDEVERAIASRTPAVHYSAEVRVLSSSRLATTLVVNGRTLPEQKFAIMDSELSQAAIERFAQSLASEVAKAARR